MNAGNCPPKLNQGTTAVSSTAVRSPNTEIASALLPCPFCGGEPAFNTARYSEKGAAYNGWDQTEFHGVNCITCGVNNIGIVGHGTKAEAAEAWNRRTTAPQTPLVDNLTGASSTDPVNCPQSSFEARREEIARPGLPEALRAISQRMRLIDGDRDHMNTSRLTCADTQAAFKLMDMAAHELSLSRPERKSIENAGE